MADHYHDRDTVVVDRGGSGMGMVLGIVAIVLAVAVWWMALGPGAGGAIDEGGEAPVPSIGLPSVAPQGS